MSEWACTSSTSHLYILHTWSEDIEYFGSWWVFQPNWLKNPRVPILPTCTLIMLLAIISQAEVTHTMLLISTHLRCSFLAIFRTIHWVCLTCWFSEPSCFNKCVVVPEICTFDGELQCAHLQILVDRHVIHNYWLTNKQIHEGARVKVQKIFPLAVIFCFGLSKLDFASTQEWYCTPDDQILDKMLPCLASISYLWMQKLASPCSNTKTNQATTEMDLEKCKFSMF